MAMSRKIPRFKRYALLLVTLLIALTAACGSDNPEQAKIEDFPTLLLGTWEEIGGPVGTLSFTGTDLFR